MSNERAIRIAQANLIALQALRITELEQVVEQQRESIRRLQQPVKPTEQAKKEASC